MKLRVFIGLFLLCGFSLLHAQPYAGIKVGSLDYDLPNFKDATTVEVYFGQRINRNLAVEFNFVDFGESEDGIPPVWTLSGNSVGLGLRVFAPVSDQVDLTARLGFHSWEVELSEEGYGLLAKDDGTDLFYGFGINVDLTPNLGLGAHFTQYDLDEEDASEISFQLQLNF